MFKMNAYQDNMAVDALSMVFWLRLCEMTQRINPAWDFPSLNEMKHLVKPE